MSRSLAVFLASIALCLAGLAGCQTYHPAPLNEKTVDQALTPPAEDVLRVDAARLKHPILQPVTIDFSQGLTPDEAAVLAVLVNPSLRSVRDQRALADAQLLQAGILPNPTLGYSADIPSGGVTADTVQAWGFDLSWEVTSLISRSAHVKSARANRAAVDLDVAWQEWQTAQSARLAVYDLIGLQRQTALAEERTKRLKDNLALVRRASAEGQMTAMDLAAAETSANQSQADLLDLQKQTEAQRLQLNRVLGLPPAQKVILRKDIALPERFEPPPDDQLTSGVEQRRLDLVALRRGYDSQEETVRAAVLEQFPKINLGLNYSRDTGNVVTTGFGIDIDLPLFDRNQGQIAQERATRRQLFDEYTDRVFQARADIADARAAILFLNRQIRTAREGEPSLRRLVETYRKGVEQGVADVLSYYTAWNDLTDRQIQILDLETKLQESKIALELAAGLYRVDGAETAAPIQGENNSATNSATNSAVAESFAEKDKER